MADKTLAEMTESELRQLIAEQTISRNLRVKYKVGDVEFEITGNPEDVKNLSRLLARLATSQKPVAEPVEEYDFEKDKTVALGPGPEDFGERAEEILAENATQYGWTLKKDGE